MITADQARALTAKSKSRSRLEQDAFEDVPVANPSRPALHPPSLPAQPSEEPEPKTPGGR
jgi:hypothetical protein